MKKLIPKILITISFCLIPLLNTDLYAQTNVLTNPGAETGDATGWTITASGGNGWNYDWGVRTGSHGFASSYGWDVMVTS